MPSIFSLETELTLMFMNTQSEVKNLTSIHTEEFTVKQKKDLEKFKNKLEEYKIILESSFKSESVQHNKKDISNQDEWFEINCKK
jgi:hypothetical protein